MSPVLREIFPKRYWLAVAVGSVLVAVGVVIMKVANLADGWGWAVLLISMFVASLVDREDFYGTPPRERH